jgi:hypothetical protein|tara:strand:- start:783 stop:959 length:177 start_codon:yes stop_codon:yes gene_type:complete
MSTARDKITEKHRARLSKLPANSGHARVLRAKLGLDAPAPTPAPAPPVAKKKKAKKKK